MANNLFSYSARRRRLADYDVDTLETPLLVADSHPMSLVKATYRHAIVVRQIFAESKIARHDHFCVLKPRSVSDETEDMESGLLQMGETRRLFAGSHE